MQLRQEEGHFTYADYCTWDDNKGQRYELIDGVPYLMASPAPRHQEVMVNLSAEFRAHLKGKKCKVYTELDVRLNPDKSDDTIVRPDLIVVCDPDKIGEDNILGAPDLVIEILSPSTAGYDMTRKFARYQKAGVKELWFADPIAQTMLVNKWDDSGHTVDLYENTDKITVGILPELTIDMRDIFETEDSSTLDEGEIS